MIMQLIRSNWYRLVPLLSIAICFGVLIAAGIVFLIQHKWFIWWCVGGFCLSIISILIIKIFSAKSKKDEILQTSQPKKSWSVLEISAWDRVQDAANQVEKSPPKNLQEMQAIATQVVTSVANTLHPNSAFASAHFTLPDILLAVEKGIKDFRAQVVSKVPGSDVIKVSQLLGIHAFYKDNGSIMKTAWYAYRLLRLSMNPAQAAIQEAKEVIESESIGGTLGFVHGQLARLVVEEIGRAAIDLYGGRLRVEVQNLVASANAAAPDVTEALTVRVAVFGQVNAGKSSLINALLEDVKATVSELPTPIGLTELRLKSDGRPDLVLIDAPGLNGSSKNEEIMLAAAEKADLVLWVVSAANPARSVDQHALNILQKSFDSRADRKAPPVIVVTTHVDRLSPQREWQPPYDIQSPSTTKAENIRASLEAIAFDLVHAQKITVPVSIRAGVDPYNLDALWVAMSMNLDEAKHTALHRELKNYSNFGIAKLGSQAFEGGRFLWGISFDGIKRSL